MDSQGSLGFVTGVSGTFMVFRVLLGLLGTVRGLQGFLWIFRALRDSSVFYGLQGIHRSCRIFQETSGFQGMNRDS